MRKKKPRGILPSKLRASSLDDIKKYVKPLDKFQKGGNPTRRSIRRNTERPETRAESEFYRQFSIGRHKFSDQNFIEDKDKIEWKGQPGTGRLYPDISEQYPEVDYKGDRHWNIKRFAYEPQIVGGYAGSHVYNTADGGINPPQLPESTKDRKNLLLQDLYKYNLADPDVSRKEAWRESKKFMRKEINPLINSRYHKFSEMGVSLGRSDSMRNWFDNIDMYNKQGYSDDPVEQRMTGYRGNNRQISKRGALKGLKEFNRDFKQQSPKEARENARKELNEWENRRERTKESIEKAIKSGEINIAGKDSDIFQGVYGDSNWTKRDARSLERLQKKVDKPILPKYQLAGMVGEGGEDAEVMTSSGQNIESLQRALNNIYPELNLNTEGVWGPETAKAYKRFKREYSGSPALSNMTGAITNLIGDVARKQFNKFTGLETRPSPMSERDITSEQLAVLNRAAKDALASGRRYIDYPDYKKEGAIDVNEAYRGDIGNKEAIKNIFLDPATQMQSTVGRTDIVITPSYEGLPSDTLAVDKGYDFNPGSYGIEESEDVGFKEAWEKSKSDSAYRTARNLAQYLGSDPGDPSSRQSIINIGS